MSFLNCKVKNRKLQKVKREDYISLHYIHSIICSHYEDTYADYIIIWRITISGGERRHKIVQAKRLQLCLKKRD